MNYLYNNADRSISLLDKIAFFVCTGNTSKSFWDRQTLKSSEIIEHGNFVKLH